MHRNPQFFLFLFGFRRREQIMTPHKNRHCPGLEEKKCFDCKDCAFVTEESQNYFRNLLSKVDKAKEINYD